MKKATLTEDKAEKTPTGGVLVGKREGQTIIHNKGTLSGYLVGKTHAEGGIKAVNKSTGQPLEMQGGEVVITAPAVSDNTKNEFNGKMMTNREILSQINVKGGGVAFAKDGMEIPKSVKHTGASYNYGGKTMTDHEIIKHITGGHLAKGMTLTQIAKKHKVSLKELQKQVDKGMKAESEHTSSKREQMKIVKDHLYENPKYYTLLKKAGLEDGGLTINGFDVDYFETKRGVYANLEIPSQNPTFEDDIQIKGFGKTEKEAFKDLKKELEIYLKKSNYNHGGRVHRGSLVRDAKSGNTPARDLNNYNDVLDLQADNMVGADTGLFEDGGMFNTEPFLNYYFDEIAEFLKYQNNITLNKDFTFKYKGELFRVEPIVLSEKNIKEAYFSIIDSDNEEVGDIVFNPNNNKKFEANSDFFDWNNIKFYDGGNVKPYDANMEGDSADMVFDEGGATDLPKVNFVKVSSTGSSLSSLTGKEFYNFREFKEAVESVYKTLNQNVKSSIYLAVNGVGITFSTYISSGKNTVANFNPYTGKPSDLEKVFIKRHRYRFNQYNWQDWFGVQENAKTTRGKKAPTQTPNSTPASSGKFSAGEIDVFNQIDNIVKEQGIIDVSLEGIYLDNKTKDFVVENKQTNEVFVVRKYLDSLSFGFELAGKEKTKALLKDYKEWKASKPASSNESKGIEITSMIIKYYDNDDNQLTANIDNILDLKKQFDTLQQNKSTQFVYLFPIEGANPTDADGRMYLTKTPSDDEDFAPLSSSVSELKYKLKNIIFKDQNYDWNKFFDWTEKESQTKTKEKVSQVNLKYRANNNYSEVFCYTIQDLKSTLDEIQIKEKHQYVDFKIITNEPALGFDKWITDFDGKNSRFDINPKNTSIEELKTLLKDLWTDGKLDWSDFFKENQTSQTQTPTTPELVKSNRNFELERKYLTGRINDLSKELDMKRPSLINEEIAFYQREINKFILKLRKVMNDQNEEKPITERIEAVYGVKWGDYDKQYPETDLVSYNGVKSELTQEEYLTVRTPEFKAFFGDWEQGSSAGYSKVINPKTKEPLAVWHGTNVLFTEWKTYATNNAHYFSTKRDFSEFFASEWESRTDKAGVDSKVLKDLNPNKGKFMFRCFIDVRNPIDFSRFGVDKRPISDYLTFLKINYNIGDYDFWTGLGNASGVTKDTKVYAWQIIRLWQNFTTYVKLYTTYDGYIFYEYNPNTPSGGIDNASLCFCAFESNQVKFTNAYEFNALSNDSRFDFGGDI